MAETFTCCWVFLMIVRLSLGEVQVFLNDSEVFGNSVTFNISQNRYTVNTFLGIPYAKPPLGDLRFRKPQKFGPLNKVFYAYEYGPSCIQLSSGILPDVYKNQSEDCLTLNVYVPTVKPDTVVGYEVLVWIHGGGLEEGSSESYNPTYLAALGNIIVVTFNYRMNVFGFLSTGDEVAPGNYGLWDQRLVLEWVQENIHYFRGYRLRVTIGGESAGGACCILHANLKNKELFRSMILQSATSLTPYNLTRKEMVVDRVKFLASRVGCDIASKTNEQIVACIKTRSAAQLLNVTKEERLKFTPIIDGDLLTFDPSQLFQKPEGTDILQDERNNFNLLNTLSGFNSYDGAKTWLFQFQFIPENFENFMPSDEDVDLYIRVFAENYHLTNYKDELRALIKAEYTNWTAPMDVHARRLQLTKLAGDMLYSIETMGFKQMQTALSASVYQYLYYFRAEPTHHFLPTQSWIQGANHADELRFVFSMDKFFPGENPNTNWEMALSHSMIAYWASFVKTGDPNLKDSALPRWPEYKMETQYYLSLDQNISVGQYLYAREANFWLHVFPRLVKSSTNEPSTNDTRTCTSGGKSLADNGKFGAFLLALSLLLL